MAPPRFGNSLFDHCWKIVVSFTTKYAVPPQIKPRILKLSIRRRQSNLIIVARETVSFGSPRPRVSGKPKLTVSFGAGHKEQFAVRIN